MERVIRLAWHNFWPAFYDPLVMDEGRDKIVSLFTHMLFPYHSIEICQPTEADLLVTSVFDHQPIPDVGIPRVLFLGENWSAPWAQCDYAFSHRLEPEIEGCANFTLPLFALYPDLEPLLYPPLLEPWNKRDFCSFVVSNPHCQQRNAFFHSLSQYRQVSSGGRHLNNIGYCLQGGHSNGEIFRFLHRHRFNICFENSIASGYNTEKLVQAMAAGTIPIYWGSETVKQYFNSESILYLQEDASNLETLLHQIEAIDSDEHKYQQMLSQPRIQESTVKQFSSSSLARIGSKILQAL